MTPDLLSHVPFNCSFASNASVIFTLFCLSRFLFPPSFTLSLVHFPPHNKLYRSLQKDMGNDKNVVRSIWVKLLFSRVILPGTLPHHTAPRNLRHLLLRLCPNI